MKGGNDRQVTRYRVAVAVSALCIVLALVPIPLGERAFVWCEGNVNLEVLIVGTSIGLLILSIFTASFALAQKKELKIGAFICLLISIILLPLSIGFSFMSIMFACG
jgi:hypothetical protein